MLGQDLSCGKTKGGQEVCLVPTRSRHLPNCGAWLADPEITRYLVTPFAVSEEGEEKWLSGAAANPDRVIWSIEVEGVHVGQAGIGKIDQIARTGITGIMIGNKEYWRQGIASAVMRRRAEYAFGELNMRGLYTKIFVHNAGSRKAAEAAGYQQYGIEPDAKWLNGEYIEAWLAYLSRARFEELRDKG